MSLNRWIERARAETRDLLELVLLPGLVVLLPWSSAFKLVRRIARHIGPYEETTRVAIEKAKVSGWLGAADHWSLVRRIVALVDHADLYLTRTRSDAWMARYMDVHGHWPPADQSGLLLTFHWGAGMWGLRHARASGLKAHALVAPLQGPQFIGRAVLHKYARARIAQVGRSLGCPTLDTSVSLRPALQALRRGEQVMAAVDVPADQASASQEICLLGKRARMPRALLRLAVDHGLPVTVYLTGLNINSGRRYLRIHQLGVAENLQQLMTEVFAFLDKAIREDPPAWHFWSEADRIFVPESESLVAESSNDGQPLS